MASTAASVRAGRTTGTGASDRYPATMTPGEVKLGPLTIYFPDASFKTFWFMHDLCDIVGVEYNSEAQARLEGALRGKMRGIDLDHEADNVVVHARGVTAMTTVLIALDSVAVSRPLWQPEEFAGAIADMRRWRRPKPIAYDVGAFVAVPLAPFDPRARFGAAQVAVLDSALWSPAAKAEARKDQRGSPLLFLFDLAASSIADLTERVASGAGTPLGCRIVVDSDILSGTWPVIGARPVSEVAALAALRRERHESTTGVADLLLCYANVWAWDVGAEVRLLPGVAPPPWRRYLRDLLEARLVAAFGSIPSPVTRGPAVLHVHIAYPGNGLPRIIDGPKAPRLAALMQASVPGIGNVFTGGGGGFFDVIARTSDAEAGVRASELALAELRLTKDALIDCYPAIPLDELHVVERAFPARP